MMGAISFATPLGEAGDAFFEAIDRRIKRDVAGDEIGVAVVHPIITEGPLASEFIHKNVASPAREAGGRAAPGIDL